MFIGFSSSRDARLLGCEAGVDFGCLSFANMVFALPTACLVTIYTQDYSIRLLYRLFLFPLDYYFITADQKMVEKCTYTILHPQWCSVDSQLL